MIAAIAQSALSLLRLPRAVKRLVALSVDASVCVLTVWLAFYLRLGEFVTLVGPPMWAVLAALAFALPLFIVFGLYRAIFRFSGWPALMTVAQAIAVYGLLYAAIFTAVGVDGVPRTVGLIQPLLLLLVVGGSRALARYWLGGIYQSQLRVGETAKVLIYGAGNAGRQLSAAIGNTSSMRVVGFLDDDPRLQGRVLNGLPIYRPNDLVSLVSSLNIRDVLLALPTSSRKRRNEILNQMLQARVSVRTLPSVAELVEGKVSTLDLRELDIEDLLGRDPVEPDQALLSKNLKDKVVLVTGAGGSIGSELCRQIVQASPSTLLLVEQSEFALYAIHQELLTLTALRSVKLVPLLGSVRDEQRIDTIFCAWRPETIFHAAAYKHVPLVEHNPVEGIKNNVFGTLVVAQAAAKYGVADFVLISTDKAVRPTNIMGASKRLAEMVLQAIDHEPINGGLPTRTRFSMVRFGNVLGSSGSVVPKFRRQIRDGGPITLTHKEIARYFMTIPEAAQLVIQAGAMAEGGDVFVLDMGQAVKIMDLARRMIELSGLVVRDEQEPDGDIAIEIIGLRPGEKLYEELLIGDNPIATKHERIMKAREGVMPWSVLEQHLAVLQTALARQDNEKIRAVLTELVTGYTASKDIVDWVVMVDQSPLPDLSQANVAVSTATVKPSAFT
jgi:FlaA1/EpsC-like NDP-sugar epimerase